MSEPVLAARWPIPHDLPGMVLTDAERSTPSLTLDDSLFAAVATFQEDPELRLIPVVDAGRRPIGAIFETDVRRLLLNSFGHALLRNPAYGRGVARHLRPCPVAEATLDAAGLIDAYRTANGSEGMILTLDGRLFGVIGNRRLVHLAAEREISAARSRVARAQRIERASERFEAEAAALAEAMRELSASLEHNAGSTAERATDLSDRALAVATAASQTSTNMGEIAGQGRELVAALGGIADHVRNARTSTTQAVTLVGAGTARAQQLLRSAQSIHSVISLISEIAGQVNLLALNATIEAARAGEAGRGFSVVAQEVKQLSTQTAGAAARITAHVRDICHGIEEVAAGQEQIEYVIEAMAVLASEVQAAVESQEKATRTIALHVDQAVDASVAIQQDVEAVGDTSRAASASAQEMGTLAARLRRGATALSGQVDTFLVEIRGD